jgi:predicted SnoaL-like aldol condensation-catalyzing enzyme
MRSGEEAAMTDYKEVATEFLGMVAGGQVEEAYRRCVAEGFRHHNPWFRGDAAALSAGMAQNARQYPGKALEVKQVLQEGDRVAVLSHVRHTPDEPGFAVVHIFRFEGGRIAELWDLAQAVPEGMANENGMF